MKLVRYAFAASCALMIGGCGNANPIAQIGSTSPSALASASAPVAQFNSGVDCTELGFNGTPQFINQAALVLAKKKYQIATVTCQAPDGTSSAEVVESFVQDNGQWASNGLASGPDVAFRTTGECIDDLVSKIQCPASVTSENGSQVLGTIEISGDNGQPVWTFVPAN